MAEFWTSSSSQIACEFSYARICTFRKLHISIVVINFSNHSNQELSTFTSILVFVSVPSMLDIKVPVFAV